MTRNTNDLEELKFEDIDPENNLQWDGPIDSDEEI